MVLMVYANRLTVVILFLLNWSVNTKNWKNTMPSTKGLLKKPTRNWIDVRKSKTLTRKRSKFVLANRKIFSHGIVQCLKCFDFILFFLLWHRCIENAIMMFSMLKMSELITKMSEVSCLSHKSSNLVQKNIFFSNKKMKQTKHLFIF